MGPAHPGSPPPRKRMMLSQGQASGALLDKMAPIRQQSMLEVFEQLPFQLGRQRRHHSDPGACVLKMQKVPAGFLLGSHPSTTAPATAACAAIHIMPDTTLQQGIHLGKSSTKRERTSSSGDVIACPTSSSSSSGSSAASGPPAFTITVDCRPDSATAATALWQRMHQLERRNKELEQQLVERMQAAQISNCSSSDSRRQQQTWKPGQQTDRVPGLTSPRAHADLEEPESSVAMDVEPACSSAQPTAQHGPGSTPGPHTQQQQQQQAAATDGLRQQASGVLLQQQALDPAGPQRLVQTLRAQAQKLQKELQRQKQLNTMLTSDNADLEAVLKETERQRREFAARYAFMTLDTDADGYVSVEQVLTYDLFSCYAPSVLMAAFSVWRWDSGFPGYLCMDDFVRFVEYAEDRSTRESQRFWFSVMDADGDGRLSWADMKLLYDAVQRSCSGGMLLHFEDLMNQIRDMVARQREPASGFTAQEMWECKLGAGVIGLLTNANNMLLQRSTAEWGRGDFPL